ncbi:hypothetical protein [Cellvibrio sp. PSBB023]|uniref:hypothetical protein n=1 Tax=Cellvibrio sp. PSBB023 TaxID=1945512 RepID=UPI00122E86DD|nr:hypothetical protein [Cellvibrio sp. PSBB023]
MKYFDDKARVNSQLSPAFPSWVSGDNASLEAWKITESLKKERTAYINRHRKISDFELKKTYQIKPSEIARLTGITRPTLMHTSSYSKGFSDYLAAVNRELAELKDRQISNAGKKSPRGSIRSNKDDLLHANVELRKALSEMENKNIENLVRHAFDQLPLPIKRKLGID